MNVVASAEVAWTLVYLAEGLQGATHCGLQEVMTFGMASSGFTSLHNSTQSAALPRAREWGKEAYAASAHTISVYVDCNQEKEYV